MLKNNLFTIQKKEAMENGCIYYLLFNALHSIYAAHFPGNPVTPGACIIQIIKELAEDLYQKEMRIISVKNTKFLNVINPLETKEIKIQLSCTNCDDGSISASGIVTDETTVFAKVSLILL